MLRGSHVSGDSRRPLRTPQLTSAGLNTEFNSLDDERYFIEFDTKYLGDIPGVSIETDTTNRTEVLKIIDRGKKQGLIPLYVSYDHDAILYISKYLIRISRRDGIEEVLISIPQYEEVLISIPLHEVAQVCYVKEDGLQILAVKHGTPEKLNLAVLHCTNKNVAEGICSLVSQCFHLVYQEVMIDLIEDTIDVALTTHDNRSLHSGGTGSTPIQNSARPDFLSNSEPNIPVIVDPGTASVVSTDSNQAVVLRDYMWQLQTKLKPEELKTFSSLLKSWNYASDKFQDFCNDLYQLYGPEKKYLLTGMFPFIPERDLKAFENFLAKHDVSLYSQGSGQGTISSHHGYPQQLHAMYTRSISDVSIHSQTANSNDLDLGTNGEDFDTELDAMGKKMEKIGLSVGETAQSYLPATFDKNSKI